jgi:hypothetical protein
MTFKKLEKKDLKNKSLVKESTVEVTEVEKDTQEAHEDKLQKPKILESFSLPIIEDQKTEVVAPSKSVDDTLLSLTKDLQFNKYFIISKEEAKKIAKSMILDGKKSILNQKWFLNETERQSLCDELSKKFNIQ